MVSGGWRWTLPSAVGPLVATADARGALVRLQLGVGAEAGERVDPGPFRALGRWLDAWSSRAPIPVDFPLAPPGTDFQVRVWAALGDIPFGATCTYAELAARVGGPRHTRAVGRANGSNPVALVVPCHRVIGADGSLVGYAAGLELKRRLLVHEGALLL
jgi:methylated-DNA-[protein]-cysteine S-methyltransferase